MTNKEVLVEVEGLVGDCEDINLDYYTTSDVRGRQSKKIVIEYDVKEG